MSSKRNTRKTPMPIMLPLAQSTPVASVPLAQSTPVASVPLAQSTPVASVPLAQSTPVASSIVCDGDVCTFEKKDSTDIITETPVEAESPLKKLLPKTPRIEKEQTSHLVFEDELEKLGYRVEQRLLVCDDDSTSCYYVKAETPSGYSIFIDLDQDGDVRSSPKDMRLKPSKPESNIPRSIRNGSYENIKEDANGVALVCRDGVCFIERNPDTLEPHESNYTLRNVEESRFDEFPTPYPVVRYSEVISHPKSISETSQRVIHRIHSAMDRLCAEELQKMEKSITSLQKNFELFCSEKKRLEEGLNSSIGVLNEWNQYYLNMESIDEESLKKQKCVAFNINKRYELLIEMVKVCKMVSDTVIEINHCSDKYSSLTTYLKERLEKIDSVILETDE